MLIWFLKIAAVGIIVAVLNQILVRSGREEQAMMTTLAGLIVVLMMIVYEIQDLFNVIKKCVRVVIKWIFCSQRDLESSLPLSAFC